MQTITINLSDDLIGYVDNEVSKGEYNSPSDVVHHALRLLKIESETEAKQLDALRKEIQIGLDAAERGEFSERTLEEIRQDVLDRQASEPERQS